MQETLQRPMPDRLLTDMERALLAFADAPAHPPCDRATCVLCARAPGRGERMYAVLKMMSADLRRRPDFVPGRVVLQHRRRRD
jgi:hypothetical protein